MAKCFKLHVKPQGEFKFNEHDGKGYQNKAHLITIDSFTTNYTCANEIIDQFKRSNENNGVILSCAMGALNLPNKTIELLHNHNGLQTETPLYDIYREIARVPLVNLVNCDINSPEFLEFYNDFKYLIKNDNDFYNYAMDCEYYPEVVKKYFDMPLNNPFNNMQLKLKFRSYTLMRKAYKDVINYR